MRSKLKNNYYMKQVFNYFFLFIIILNAGCGKQAFFSSAEYSRRPPPPMAPLIPSGYRPSFIHAYPSNVHSFAFIAKYMGRMPPTSIKQMSITYKPSYRNPVGINTFNTGSLRSYSSLISRDIKPLSRVYPSSYMDPANINAPNVTISRSNIVEPVIDIKPQYTVRTAYMNALDIDVSNAAVNLNPGNKMDIFAHVEPLNTIHSFYIEPFNRSLPSIVDSERTNLDVNSSIRLPNTIYETSYINPTNINISHISNPRSNTVLDPMDIQVTDEVHTSYINEINFNIEGLEPSIQNPLSVSDIRNVSVDLRPPGNIQSMPQLFYENVTVNPRTSQTNEINFNIEGLEPSIQNSLSVSDIQNISVDLRPSRNIQSIPQPFYENVTVNPRTSQPVDIEASSMKIPPVIELPPPPQIIERRSQHEFHDSFSYTLNEELFFQSTYNRNRTTLFFQAFDAHLNIRDLQKDDIVLSENGIEIENYTLSSTERSRLNKDLEIVFVVDVGASMDDNGENVKENITYFVNRLQEAQMRTKFCLLKFTDLVQEGQCNIFFPDNPKTPENENTVKFLGDVSRLRFEEKSALHKQNALGGLLEASSKTPWNSNSQRMVILITNAMFWVAIESETEVDAKTAPDYEVVFDSLQQNEIQVFSLTQNYSGFSGSYSGHPPLTEASLGGQWFDIKNLSHQDMDSIFNQVEEQINISYKIEYFVEDQEGLNASLPLDEREVTLTAYNPEEINIRRRGVYSNIPEGSEQLQSYWPLNERDVNENQTFVTVDGQPVDFSIENGEIVFSNPPPSGSEIFVQYEAGSLRDNIREHTLSLPTDPKHQGSSDIQIDSASLRLNDITVPDQGFEIIFSDLENIQLRLTENIFDNTDPYGIRGSGELKISLWYEVISQHNSVN